MKNVSEGVFWESGRRLRRVCGYGLGRLRTKQAEQVSSTDSGAWSWGSSRSDCGYRICRRGAWSLSARHGEHIGSVYDRKGRQGSSLEKTGAARFRNHYGAIGGSLQRAGIDLRDVKKTFFEIAMGASWRLPRCESMGGQFGRSS
ncbi:MAG: hypothetical protein ACLT98_16820 [Eggerthellaceae bacterium]